MPLRPPLPPHHHLQVETEGSRKDFVVSERKAQQGAAMSLMKLGAVMKAVVTSVEDYGAFVDLVDLPGVSGLVRSGGRGVGGERVVKGGCQWSRERRVVTRVLKLSIECLPTHTHPSYLLLHLNLDSCSPLRCTSRSSAGTRS